ncbi:DUF2493 domain-containing protein [Moheibacter sp.]|uniref:DUF2493 domain-containing protein n=1 Tax=Moheibacter sp. TaxID=1965316 RepID=UPI003C78530A
MKIAIVGSRSFKDYELLKNEVEKFISENSLEEVTIVSGGAIGADTLAEEFAAEKGYKTIIFLPDRKTHGREACRIRNTDIVETGEVVFAFWDGISTGTKDSIDKAQNLNKSVFIHLF